MLLIFGYNAAPRIAGLAGAKSRRDGTRLISRPDAGIRRQTCATHMTLPRVELRYCQGLEQRHYIYQPLSHGDS